MSLEQQLLKLKNQLKDDENSLIRIVTEKQLELKKLQKKGLKTSGEARKAIGQWKVKKEKIQKEVQDKLDSINDSYGVKICGSK